MVTDATDGLLLIHVPPDVGDNVVVVPTQMFELPEMLTAGNALTVKLFEDEHPEELLVKVSVIVPALIPVTIPESSTVAIPVLLLIHVPPLLGVTLAVEPAQT